MAMKTIRRGAEFTGFVMLRHKACGYAARIEVGRHYGGGSNGYAPDGKTPAWQWEYPGCEWREYNVNGFKGRNLIHRCQCGAALRVDLGERIYGRYVAEIVCNSKCMSAVGPACDCSCGGQNHGAGHGIVKDLAS